MEQERIDEQMRQALRRVDAPAGLADTIVARAEARAAARRRRLPARWLALAASLVLAVTTGVYSVRLHNERRAEKARADLALAIEITSAKLSKVERQLAAIGVEEIQVKENRQ
jgi:hypothetical protein